MAFGNLAVQQITVFDTPTTVYTAPSPGAVVTVVVTNIQGIPLYFNLSVGTASPANVADYIAVKRILAPNIANQNSPQIFEKLVLSANEKIILTMLHPEDGHDYYDQNTFGINVRVQGADGSDLSSARYTF